MTVCHRTEIIFHEFCTAEDCARSPESMHQGPAKSGESQNSSFGPQGLGFEVFGLWAPSDILSCL